MGTSIKQEERQKHILQLLEIRGVVSVTDLSKELGTSAVTIRKDLQRLEDEGKLLRVAGGALSSRKKRETLAEKNKSVINRELKDSVARKAAELFIHDGDNVIVTSGMTPYLTLVHASGCTDLRILTDSLMIAEGFCSRADYQVILFGGEVNEKDAFVYGRDTVRQAGRYMADKVIVTMDGIDPDSGLTALRPEGADTMKMILSRARRRIVVADITKIGKESFCNIGEITLADVLVTNRSDDPKKQQLLKKIEEAGVELVYADENNEKEER